MSTLIIAKTPSQTVTAIRTWLNERAAFEEATPTDDKGKRLLTVARVHALRSAAEALNDVVILPPKE